MTQIVNFPINVFEDVKGEDFLKHNKKNVTEDYVTENFKECGWKVYRPFNDTGIDLIATKEVCPKGHTLFNEQTNSLKKCSNCSSDLIQIKRFIQVKTREIKGNDDQKTFGYTLKSKDFRNDPRHIFLLYSDFSNSFIIIPIFNYLEIFYTNPELGKSHFAVPSFRQNNNKLNSLKNNSQGWFWNPSTDNINLNRYVNEKGMELISNPDIDLNIKDYVDKITKMKLSLFYTYSKGRQTNLETERLINTYLASHHVVENKELIKNMRITNKNYLKAHLSSELINSIENGYLVKFKGVSLKDE